MCKQLSTLFHKQYLKAIPLNINTFNLSELAIGAAIELINNYFM